MSSPSIDSIGVPPFSPHASAPSPSTSPSPIVPSSGHRKSSVYSSLKSRRQGRDRARREEDALASTLSASQLLACLESLSSPPLLSFVTRCAQTLSRALDGLTVEQAENYLRRPEVACLIHEFATGRRAEWNQHHQTPGSGSQPLSPMYPGSAASAAASGIVSATGQASPLALLSPAGNPSPGSAGSGSTTPFKLSRSTSGMRSSMPTAEDMLALREQAQSEKLARNALHAPDRTSTWLIPQRLVFWKGSLSSGPKSPVIAPFGSKDSAQQEEKQPHPPLNSATGSSPSPPPQPTETLAPHNALLSNVIRTHQLTDPGVLVSIDGGEMNLWTGIELNVVGDNVCVCFTRRSGTRDASAHDNAEDSMQDDLPSADVADIWDHLVCTIGPIGAHGFASAKTQQQGGRTTAIPAAPRPIATAHTQLLQSLLDVTKVFAPNVQAAVAEFSTTSQVDFGSTTELLSPVTGGGSATAAAKVLRSTATHASSSQSDQSIPSHLSSTLQSFELSLERSQSTLQSLIHLTGPPSDHALPATLQLDQLDEATLFAYCASRGRVQSFEATLVQWIGQIERLFRDQADEGNQAIEAALAATSSDVSDIGPRSELALWERRLALLDHLVAQFSNFSVQSVLLLLGQYKSRHLTAWSKVHGECLGMLYESRDNCKYLSSFVSTVAPVLYSGSAQELIHSFPGLMDSISSIVELAAFYRSSEHLTALFVKITGQLVRRCIQLLKPESFWFRPKEQAWMEVKQILSVTHAYRHAYDTHRTKLQQSSPFGTQQFDLSTREIFRALDGLEERLGKVQNMLETLLQFSRLRGQLTVGSSNPDDKIEGLDAAIEIYLGIEREVCLRGGADLVSPRSPKSTSSSLSQEFFSCSSSSGSNVHSSASSSDSNNTLFDTSPSTTALFTQQHERFSTQIIGLDDALVTCMHAAFQRLDEYGQPRSDWTSRSLKTVIQYNSLLSPVGMKDGSFLPSRSRLVQSLRSHHASIFSTYSADLAGIKFLYQTFRKSPPTLPCTPPVASTIQWARQLLRKVRAPMKVIVEYRVHEFEDAWGHAHSHQTTPAKAASNSGSSSASGRAGSPAPPPIHSSPASHASHGHAHGKRRPSDASESSVASSLGAPSAHAHSLRLASCGPIALKVVKMYNALVSSLVSFEQQTHRAWIDSLSSSKTLLRTPILFQRGLDAETLAQVEGSEEMLILSTGASVPATAQIPSLGPAIPGLGINFSPSIFTATQESKYLLKLGLFVPDEMVQVLASEKTLKKHHSSVAFLVREYHSILSKMISQIYLPLLKPRLQRLWQTKIFPGLTTTITWSSVKLDLFVEEALEELYSLETLLEQCNSLLHTRVLEGGLDFLVGTDILALPNQIITVIDFQARAEEQVRSLLPVLAQKSYQIEYAVYELVQLVTSGYTRDELRSVRADRDKLIQKVHSLQFHAVGEMIEGSLRKLKEKFVASQSNGAPLSGSSAAGGLFASSGLSLGQAFSNARPPVFSVSLSLTGLDESSFDEESNAAVSHGKRSIEMIPSLPEIQSCMNQTAKAILFVSKGIVIPGQVRPAIGLMGAEGGTNDESSITEDHPLETFYIPIGKNRRIIKLMFQLQGAFLGLVSKVQSFLRNISKDVEFLWLLDCREEISAWIASWRDAISVEAFRAQLDSLVHVEGKVREIPDRYIIDSLSFSAVQLKSELLVLVQDWKNEYGKHLLSYAREHCSSLATILSHHLSALDYESKGGILTLKDLLAISNLTYDLQKDLDLYSSRITPIEDAYAALRKYALGVEESDLTALVQTKEKWNELQGVLKKTSMHLLEVQDKFKHEFLSLLKQFRKDIAEFEHAYDSSGPFLPGIPPQTACERLDVFQARYDSYAETHRFYEQLEVLFFGPAHQGPKITACPFLVRVNKELLLGQQLFGLWKDLQSFEREVQEKRWMDLLEVSASLGVVKSGTFLEDAFNMVASNNTNTASLASIDKEMTAFLQRSSVLPRGIKDWRAYEEIKQALSTWTDCVPLLQRLTAPAVKERHWALLFQMLAESADGATEASTSPPIASLPSLLLGQLLTPSFLSHRDEIDELIFHATKEHEVSVKFESVKAAWIEEKVVFEKLAAPGASAGSSSTNAKANISRKLLGILLDSKHSLYLSSKCSETRLLLNSLLNSRYNSFCKPLLLSWVNDLTKIDEVLEEWLRVQQLFVYIHTVFSSGDVARQLPEEATKFAQIESKWFGAMAMVAKDSNVLRICCDTTPDALSGLLPWMSTSLESCQKMLSSYLESKRLIFPRMYFLSDQVLLELLGHGNDVPKVQSQLYALFDNIKEVSIQRDARKDAASMEKISELMRGDTAPDESIITQLKKPNWIITGMISAEGEQVKLRSIIPCVGNIENWLKILEKESHETIRSICAVALNSIEVLSTNDFLKKFPAQLVLLSYQLQWTRSSEEGIRGSKKDRNSMMTQFKKMQDLLKVFVSLTNNPKLSELTRQTVETLITVQVHQRDVYEKLIKAKVRSIQDFDWLRQTRFYWIWEKSHCQVCITDVEFVYGNEYMGSAGRLVITPLTDRCYVTLAQALGLGLGGSPVGPAGTGKTETVKDMGRTLGKFVVILNCSDQMDYLQLGKIFKGVALSGVWSDFDEFNRIKLEVLSVVAQQISCILTAIREYKPTTTFTDGSVISVDSSMGVFITMNPTYAGRQELPENLKALFRSVSMMVPERHIIIQVRLAASGFHRNYPLSKKFTLLYHLCEQQLSKQRHYDFGLRNILSVLRVLGPAKRQDTHNRSEEEIFIQVVREMNVSKLVDTDETLFLAMLEDVFPKMAQASNATAGARKTPEQAKFEEGLAEYCSLSNLIPHPNWTRKISELNQILAVRHGLMILGPSASGKSAALEGLRHALGKVDCPRSIRRMNPKAITAAQMFGRLDETTQDWTEGIFSNLWRQSTAEAVNSVVLEAPIKPWIILDGPVDTLWIENLNSVLDDSRVLTLANGDRLGMPKDLRLIFEVESLHNASPATVSRAGMIYMSASTLHWSTLIDAWLNARTREIKSSNTKPSPPSVPRQQQQVVSPLTPPRRSVVPEIDPPPLRGAALLAHEFSERCTDLYTSDATLVSQTLHHLIPHTLKWFHDSGVVPVMRLEENNRVQTLLNYMDGLLALRLPLTEAERAEERAEAYARENGLDLSPSNHAASTNIYLKAPSKLKRPVPPPGRSPSPQPPLTPSGASGPNRSATQKREIVATTATTLSPPAATTPSSPARQSRHAALGRIMLFSIVWGLGGMLSPADRIRFQDFLSKDLGLKLPFSYVSPSGRTTVGEGPKRKDASTVSGETVFDFYLSHGTFQWTSWKALVGRWKYLEKLDRFRAARVKIEEDGDGPNDLSAPGKAIKLVEDELEEEAEIALIGGSGELDSPSTKTPRSRHLADPDNDSIPAQPAGLNFESPSMLARWLQSPSLSPVVASKLLVPSYSSIFIPTVDSVRAEYAMMLVAKQSGKSLLLVGEMGVAKTVTAQRFIDLLCNSQLHRRSDFLGSAPAIRSTSKTVNFSSATTPELFQSTLESCLVKRFGNVFGPPQIVSESSSVPGSPGMQSKRASTRRSSMAKDGLSPSAASVATEPSSIHTQLTLFLDDLNMPSINSWGDQVTNELVRQVMEHREVYSLARPGEKIIVQDVNLLAAMNLPYGGRNDISNRLKGRFHIFYLTPPSKESLDVIYTSIIQAYFNSEHGFRSAEIIHLSRSLPKLARTLWTNASKTLLPTPTRSHYLFNIRDISRIFEGLCVHANPAIINTEARLVNLWSSECQRVLGDKLINQSDKDWLTKEFRRCIDQMLPSFVTANVAFQEELFPSTASVVPAVAAKHAAQAANESAPPYFVHFLRDLDFEELESGKTGAQQEKPVAAGSSTAPRSMAELAKEQEESAKSAISASKNALLQISSYEPAPPLSDLRVLLNAYLEKYNSQARVTPMQLVFFPNAIEHLLRICRVLSTPNKGHAMLVGIGGCGKQSLTRLAAFITGTRLVSPALTSSPADFLDLLKGVYMDCGIRGVKVTLLVTDSDLAKADSSAYLEYLNIILTSCEVARMFSRDELANMLFELRMNLDRERELRQRELNLWEMQRKEQMGESHATTGGAHSAASSTTSTSPPIDYHKEFLNRVRANLHLVLCFSPLHPKFRSRALQFPGIISGCTIDWFSTWTHDALVSVSEKFLADVEVPIIHPHAPPTAKPVYAALSPVLRSALAQFMSRVHTVTEEHATEYAAMFKRHVYQTPKTFIKHVEEFKFLYAAKLNELQLQHTRLTGGLSKLIQAEKDISALEYILSEREQDLAVASKQLSVLMAEINANKTLAQAKSAEMTQVRNRMVQAAKTIERDRQEAEEDLAAATPLIIAAQKALDTISQKDINLLKALRTPHNLIERVFDAILILNRKDIRAVAMDERFGPQASQMIGGGPAPAPAPASSSSGPDKNFPRYLTSWASSVGMLRSSHFLDLLVNFPKHALDDETMELLEPYLKQIDFNPDSATQVSSWVAGLTTWVLSVKKYWEVYKFVQPKKIRLDEQKELVELAEIKLAAAEKELQQKQIELDKITKRYEESIARKDVLEKDMNQTLTKISSARALLHGLSAEQARWSMESRNHQKVLGELLGNVLLAQSFLSYSGGFNQAFRIKLRKAWARELKVVSKTLSDAVTGSLLSPSGAFPRKASLTSSAGTAGGIPFNAELNLLTFLATESLIGAWTSLQGLPVDKHSIENGLLVTHGSRFPLLVDPQGQGVAWLRRKWSGSSSGGGSVPSSPSASHLPGRELIICSASDPTMRAQLELALEHGKIFMLCDLGETVPAVLANVLDKVLLRRGKIATVSLQGIDVDFHPDFYLTLTTKLPNPHFSPEVSASARVIDFTVTHSSLESQLLERVILVEKHELEEARLELLTNIQSYRAARVELEDDLLSRLSTHQGDLLQDQGLIDILNRTKATSEEMALKITSAQEMEKKINDAREEYRQIAIRGSILFFLTADLARVNHMYQTSLPQFLHMFDEGLAAAEKHQGLVIRRVKAVVESITFSVYRSVIRGLFRQDTAMFQLLLALKVDLQRGAVKQHEFELLIKGPKQQLVSTSPSGDDSSGSSGTVSNRFHWMTQSMWLGVVALMELPYFRMHLLGSLERHATYWSEWLHSETPEVNRLPDPIMEDKLDSFARLCLVRCVRPDRTMLSGMKYIQSSIGEKFISPPPMQLDDLIRETTAQIPIVFLLSTGADPSQSVRELAHRWHSELHTISMGQGQEVRARSMVRRLTSTDSQAAWLLLQNAHLSLEFIVELQSTLAALRMESCNRDFRLIITSQPTPEFPIVFLQSAIKLTSEPPQGMKHGLARQYGSLSQETLAAVDRPEWGPLLYAICFLHCAVIERRKFGPIGWQHAYEFNSSDSHASIEWSKKYLYSEDVRKPLQFDTIRYMISQIFYCGRIIDDWDRLLMNAMGEQWITRDLAPHADKPSPDFDFAPGYPLPVGLQKVSEYLAFIDTLPMVDPPELLGLASSADIIYRHAEAAHVCKTIWAIQPKDAPVASSSSAGDGKGKSDSAIASRETELNARITSLLLDWPPDFDALKVEQQIVRLEAALHRHDHPSLQAQASSSSPMSATQQDPLSPPPAASIDPSSTTITLTSVQSEVISPLHVCLRQEVDRMQVVLKTVRNNLLDLQLTLAGSIMMTPESEAILDALYVDQVPRMWEEITWRNSNGTLTTWFADMYGIHAQLSNWLKNGAPRVFSLASFFNPQGFLTAVKQVVARTNRQWALDDMELVATVTKFSSKDQIKTRAEEGGVYITGLYLDGATWDPKRMRLADTHGSLTNRFPLPVVHVTARGTLSSAPFGYICPVYRLTDRTDSNFILSIPLTSDTRATHWIRRGVAIICSPV